MSTIAGVRIPADGFVFGEPLRETALRVTVVPTVSFALTDSTMLAWTAGEGFEEVDDAVRGCPSVRNVELVTAFDEAAAWLYRFEWVPGATTALPLLAAPDTAVLGARAREDWHVRLLFGAREQLSAGYDACRDAGVDVEVEWVRSVSEADRLGRFRVTPHQFRALETAYRLGYYEIPREVTLQELAAELGVSHQALSERLWRAHRSLVRALLSGGDPSAAGEIAPEPQADRG